MRDRLARQPLKNHLYFTIGGKFIQITTTVGQPLNNLQNTKPLLNVKNDITFFLILVSFISLSLSEKY